jgi:hypothetical protein
MLRVVGAVVSDVVLRMRKGYLMIEGEPAQSCFNSLCSPIARDEVCLDSLEIPYTSESTCDATRKPRELRTQT